jgi:hypothetical protein
MRMANLEQIRAIFDASEVGIVLIGMRRLEKRLARYAQFTLASASFTSFVHGERQTSVNYWLDDGHRLE